MKPTTPAAVAKPNRDKAPGVHAIGGQFQRVLVLRFKYQADLPVGPERMVAERRIRNGVILAGAGSLHSYHYHSPAAWTRSVSATKPVAGRRAGIALR